jgi:hypothetical protein
MVTFTFRPLYACGKASLVGLPCYEAARVPDCSGHGMEEIKL